MKNALVIAAREFEEKRFVVFAALAFAVLPFVLSVIPMINGKSPRDVIAILSLILSSGFTLGLGVILGANFIGRDLSDGRMSFYFSRPVSAASIWFGKLTAAVVLIAGCFGLIVLPALAFAGKNEWESLWTTTFNQGALFVLAVALALFLIAHVIGTFARSHSPRIAFDFAAAVGCGVAIYFLLLPLARGTAYLTMKWLAITLGVILVLTLLAGGAWQLARGRIDRRRNHAALSQFLWGSMAIALLASAAFVAWIVSVKPRDLTFEIRGERAASGPFAALSGRAKGHLDYRASFLLNTEDGKTFRLDSQPQIVRFSRDGSTAVWRVVEKRVASLWMYKRGAAKPIDTGLTMTWGDFAVSDDGNRIATYSLGIVSIYDVPQKRTLVSAHLSGERYAQAVFVSPDLLRVYLATSTGWKIFEVDAKTRSVNQTGEATSAGQPGGLIVLNADASHMLVHGSKSHLVTLNDARTGAMIAPVGGSDVRTACFLRDGRFVYIDGPYSRHVLHVLGAGSLPQRNVILGPSQWSSIVGDDGQRLVIQNGAEVLAIDLGRGAIERREQTIRVMPSPEARTPLEPLREVFYLDEDKHVVAWNPANGAKRMITGG
jgi:ABC-type transport system involved in multi-copper enzyme maturation permease subunit